MYLKSVRKHLLPHNLLSLIYNLLKSLFLNLLPHRIRLCSLRSLRNLRPPLSLAASVSPSSPSSIPETLHGDDSDDANMENVPVPPIAINPMTASDDELYHGVISDVNLLNLSAQSTDVDIDQDLYNPKRSAEASDSEYIIVTHKKKR